MVVSLFNVLSGSLLLGSVAVAISSSSVLIIWASLELNLTAFLLVLAKSEARPSSLAKYFVAQSLGSIWLLAGVATIYSSGDTFLSGGLMLSGLLLKLGLFPFHTWLVRLFEELKWGSLLLLSSIQKVAPLYLTMKLNCLSLLSVILSSASVGVIGMLGQKRFKTFIAYFSLISSSWLLLGVSSPAISWGYLALFLISLGMWCGSKGISAWGSLSDYHSDSLSWAERASGGLSSFSLSGFPPTLGFFVKLVILLQGHMIGLAVSAYFLLAMSPLVLYSFLEGTLLSWKLFSGGGWEGESRRGSVGMALGAPLLALGGAWLILLSSKRA